MGMSKIDAAKLPVEEPYLEDSMNSMLGDPQPPTIVDVDVAGVKTEFEEFETKIISMFEELEKEYMMEEQQHYEQRIGLMELVEDGDETQHQKDMELIDAIDHGDVVDIEELQKETEALNKFLGDDNFVSDLLDTTVDEYNK